MTNPYASMPGRAFWRTAVADRHPLHVAELWVPKHPINPADKIVTFGSCFAQHFGRSLATRGYGWHDAEPGPPQFVSDKLLKQFNYGVFSARTGNIYTAKALLQWTRWALAVEAPLVESWEKKGRHYDPFRPAIEPNGFESPEEVKISRKVTIEAFREAITSANVFVFTLGLTEGWENVEFGYTYAMCPGTVAGTFEPGAHRFVNYGYDQIAADMREVIALLQDANPAIRFLLTVSPVPLTATASGEHVLVATTYSKSVLRAVAGALALEESQVDYFPSYEIITSPPFRGMFYESNGRSIVPEGVAFVMTSFFRCLSATFGAPASSTAEPRPSAHDVAPVDTDPAPAQEVCEEMMLGSFAPIVS